MSGVLPVRLDILCDTSDADKVIDTSGPQPAPARSATGRSGLRPSIAWFRSRNERDAGDRWRPHARPVHGRRSRRAAAPFSRRLLAPRRLSSSSGGGLRVAILANSAFAPGQPASTVDRGGSFTQNCRTCCGSRRRAGDDVQAGVTALGGDQVRAGQEQRPPPWCWRWASAWYTPASS